MTTSTAPDLSETIALLGEIRDKLSAYPRYCDALLRAQEGLQEAERGQERDILWDALDWIDTYDPETTAAVEARFGLYLPTRTVMFKHGARP